MFIYVYVYMYVEYNVEPAKKTAATIRIKSSKFMTNSNNNKKNELPPITYQQFINEKDAIILLSKVQHNTITN